MSDFTPNSQIWGGRKRQNVVVLPWHVPMRIWTFLAVRKLKGEEDFLTSVFNGTKKSDGAKIWQSVPRGIIPACYCTDGCMCVRKCSYRNWVSQLYMCSSGNRCNCLSSGHSIVHQASKQLPGGSICGGGQAQALPRRRVQSREWMACVFWKYMSDVP